MNREKGALVIVSAPSGTGKSTVLQHLLEHRKDLRFSISATTRGPRGNEREGREYYFITREEFERRIGENAFLEYAEYAGNYYGTPREPVDRYLSEGYTAYLDIEVQGALQVREKRPETLAIFLAPPSLEELERRLVSRGTDTPGVIQKRLRQAEWEMKQQGKFDFVVVNDDVERAAAEISGLIDEYQQKMRAK